MPLTEPSWWDGQYWRDGRRVNTLWSDLLNLRPRDPDLARAQLTLYRAFGNLDARVLPNGAPELREYERRLLVWFGSHPRSEL